MLFEWGRLYTFKLFTQTKLRHPKPGGFRLTEEASLFELLDRILDQGIAFES